MGRKAANPSATTTAGETTLTDAPTHQEPHAPNHRAHEVLLGIDAGGTRTRARAVLDGRVVHEGEAGAGNPLSSRDSQLLGSYRQALDGCPAPARVGACIAGVEDPDQRARMQLLLQARFPDAIVRVAPDYVAALRAAPPGTDTCVIAGTGSLICSAVGPGRCVRSGGHGWILGDHGSGARLGQALLEWFTDAAEDAPTHLADAIRARYGTSDRRRLVTDVHQSPSPAEWLARAATLLIGEAERGAPWATTRLAAEMGELAHLTSHHIERHVTGNATVQVALAGGLWASDTVCTAFSSALHQRADRPVRIQKSTRTSLDGAVQFAAEGPEGPA